MMTTNLEFDLGSGKFFPKPVSKSDFTNLINFIDNNKCDA